jgi:hypothetical protein
MTSIDLAEYHTKNDSEKPFNELKNILKANTNSSTHSEMSSLLSLYVPPVIIFIGTIGNIFSFMVFFKLCKFKLILEQNSLYRFFKYLFIKRTWKFENQLYMQELDNRNNKNSVRGSIIKFNTKSEDQNSSILSNGVLVIYFYLCILSLFDLGVLYFGLFNQWIYDLTDINLKNYSSNMCKLLTFASFLFSHLSSFLIVLTSFIRFMGFYSPFKTAKITKIKTLKPLLVFITLFFAAVNLQFFWTMDLREKYYNQYEMLKTIRNEFNLSLSSDTINLEFLKNLTFMYGGPELITGYDCRIEESIFGQIIWPVVDKLLYSLLPFLLILVFNLFIIFNLSKAQQYRHVVYISKLKSHNTQNNESNLKNTTSKLYSSNLNKFSQHNNFNLNHRVQGNFINKTPRLQQQQQRNSLILNTAKAEKLAILKSENFNMPYTKALPSPDIEKKIKELKKSHLFGRRFTLMLMGLSFTFLILTLPAVIVIILVDPIRDHIDSLENLHESNRRYEWLGMGQRIVILLMYLNHSINFFIYYLTGARFRKQFHAFFCEKDYKNKKMQFLNLLSKIFTFNCAEDNKIFKNNDKCFHNSTKTKPKYKLTYIFFNKRPSLYS